MTKPHNNFIDETAMSIAGEPLPYEPAFGRFVPGCVVKHITQEEWDEAVILAEASKEKSND